MKTRRTVLCVTVLCALGPACGHQRVGPSRGAVWSVSIVGPDSIAPGQSAQYSVLQHLPYGSSRPTPAGAAVVWRSSNLAMLQVTTSGLATAHSTTGEAELEVHVTEPGSSGLRASRSILVLPDGTYRLAGLVTEVGSQNLPIHGALVEARTDTNTSAPPAAATTTGPDGRYRLYGVPADGYMRVSMAGFLPTTERVQLAAHGSRNFQLAGDGDGLELAGDHTLVIEADPECGSSTPLPPELRRRSFTARVAQSGARLTVRVVDSCVTNIFDGCEFRGVATPAGATFEITEGQTSSFYEYPDLVGALPNGAALVVTGTAQTTGSAAGVSGSLTGWLGHFARALPQPSQFLGSCRGGRFTLTRR